MVSSDSADSDGAQPHSVLCIKSQCSNSLLYVQLLEHVSPTGRSGLILASFMSNTEYSTSGVSDDGIGWIIDKFYTVPNSLA